MPKYCLRQKNNIQSKPEFAAGSCSNENLNQQWSVACGDSLEKVLHHTTQVSLRFNDIQELLNPLISVQ